jgi:hypothetical protein
MTASRQPGSEADGASNQLAPGKLNSHQNALLQSGF